MERISFGEKSGWELVEENMERHDKDGTCSVDYYRWHFDGGDLPPKTKIEDYRTMDSFLYYQRWKDEHPGQEVPPSVRRIRTDRQHMEWVEQGGPSLEKEKFYCSLCNSTSTAPTEEERIV